MLNSLQSFSDTYAYDGFGRQVLSRNGEVTRHFEYDDLDRASG